MWESKQRARKQTSLCLLFSELHALHVGVIKSYYHAGRKHTSRQNISASFWRRVFQRREFTAVFIDATKPDLTENCMEKSAECAVFFCQLLLPLCLSRQTKVKSQRLSLHAKRCNLRNVKLQKWQSPRRAYCLYYTALSGLQWNKRTANSSKRD